MRPSRTFPGPRRRGKVDVPLHPAPLNANELDDALRQGADPRSSRFASVVLGSWARNDAVTSVSAKMIGVSSVTFDVFPSALLV
jgi:hypothetical protein